MKWDFNNSVILGYGPTEETHCQACDGNTKRKLRKGFAFHLLDRTSGKTYVAGDHCRTKVDKRPLSTVSHFSASKPIPEETGRTNRTGTATGLAGTFKGVSDEDRLIAAMGAWVQLRQHRLPELGFSRIAFKPLEQHMQAIINGDFNIERARQVKSTYDKQPAHRLLENLQKCHDVAMQIERVLGSDRISPRNLDFLTSIKGQLISNYSLKPKQIIGLNNLAKYHGKPEWTEHLRF